MKALEHLLRRQAVHLWAYLNDETPVRERYQGDYRGRGCTRQRWYSLCSAHRPPYRERECPRCMAGKYITWWKHKLTSHLCKTSPRLWRQWANLEE